MKHKPVRQLQPRARPSHEVQHQANTGRKLSVRACLNKMATISKSEEARRFFLERISSRLASCGKPLTGFALEYWQALAPEDQQAVDQLWKDRKLRKDLDAIEKEFESILYDALTDDITQNPAVVEVYLRALNDVKSTDGVQLQAIIFTAAMRIESLTGSNSKVRAMSAIAIIVMLALGAWIGLHLSK